MLAYSFNADPQMAKARKSVRENVEMPGSCPEANLCSLRDGSCCSAANALMRTCMMMKGEISVNPYDLCFKRADTTF